MQNTPITIFDAFNNCLLSKYDSVYIFGPQCLGWNYRIRFASKISKSPLNYGGVMLWDALLAINNKFNKFLDYTLLKHTYDDVCRNASKYYNIHHKCSIAHYFNIGDSPEYILNNKLELSHTIDSFIKINNKQCLLIYFDPFPIHTPQHGGWKLHNDYRSKLSIEPYTKPLATDILSILTQINNTYNSEFTLLEIYSDLQPTKGNVLVEQLSKNYITWYICNEYDKWWDKTIFNYTTKDMYTIIRYINNNLIK